MLGNYNIYLGDQSVGMANVSREGLYYRFQCCCKLSGDIIYQVIVKCDNKETNLGICVPLPGGFGMDTKLSVKSIGEGEMSFNLVPRHPDLRGKFVPIRADEPFAYIGQLHKMHLIFVNGEPGVLVEESSDYSKTQM